MPSSWGFPMDFLLLKNVNCIGGMNFQDMYMISQYKRNNKWFVYSKVSPLFLTENFTRNFKVFNSFLIEFFLSYSRVFRAKSSRKSCVFPRIPHCFSFATSEKCLEKVTCVTFYRHYRGVFPRY